MKKHFIAMLTEEESDSNLYYVDSDYSIKKIKNNVTPEAYDKETLEDARNEIDSLVTMNENALREIGTCWLKTSQIEALKTAISTINDILMLYNNN